MFAWKEAATWATSLPSAACRSSRMRFGRLPAVTLDSPLTEASSGTARGVAASNRVERKGANGVRPYADFAARESRARHVEC